MINKEKKTKHQQEHKEKKNKETEKIKELEGKYLRALADYQNLLKQTANEKIQFIKYANETLLQEIIPVYNHLKISMQHAGDDNEWIIGVKHVLKQFKEVLTKAGVKEIETKAQEFNPLLMDALQQEETSEAEKNNFVAKEIKPGYTLQEKVIIPAQVVVYRYQPTNKKEENIEQE